MSPTGARPGYAGDEIHAALRAHARQSAQGVAVSDNKGFVVPVPRRQSFSPDAAYWIGKVPDDLDLFEGAPIFAAEIRSSGDYGPAAERAMAKKRGEYFAAGTQVVWDVDLRSDDVVTVSREGSRTADRQPPW